MVSNSGHAVFYVSEFVENNVRQSILHSIPVWAEGSGHQPATAVSTP
jgi:hypothetical protein